MANIPQGKGTFTFGGISVLPQYNSYRQVHVDVKNNTNTYYVPNRLTSMPKVDPQKIKQYYKESMNFGQYMQYFARMMLRKFAEVAARYSPPNMGKANIDAKYYMRPIYKLDDLAKGLVRNERGKRLYATKEDYAALRNGMKFKIMNTKHGVKRGTVYAYTKGINEAKRLARIQNRGLTKYSWGSILNTFNRQNIAKLVGTTKQGVKTRFGVADQRHPGRQLSRRILVQTELPVIFKRLQNKSPNIAKYRWGNVDWQEADEGNKIELTINNNLAEVERYCDIAIRQGVNAAVRETKKLIKAVQDGATEKIEAMFNFDMFKVTKFTAMTIRKNK